MKIVQIDGMMSGFCEKHFTQLEHTKIVTLNI